MISLKVRIIPMLIVDGSPQTCQAAKKRNSSQRAKRGRTKGERAKGKGERVEERPFSAAFSSPTTIGLQPRRRSIGRFSGSLSGSLRHHRHITVPAVGNNHPCAQPPPHFHILSA